MGEGRREEGKGGEERGIEVVLGDTVNTNYSNQYHLDINMQKGLVVLSV